MGAAYAVCHRHVLDAMQWAVGRSVKVIEVSPTDERYRCHCRKGADFFLREL